MVARDRRAMSAPGLGMWEAPAPFFDATLRTVTPMIGGGFESTRLDPDRLVNGKAIRGHLRDWWRACNAHRYRNAVALFEAEARLWGAAAQFEYPNAPSHSLIQVDVDVLQTGSDIRITKGNENLPPYVMFPFTTGERAGSIAGREDVRFRIQLSETPGIALDVPQRNEAIIATVTWIAFGGVGSRTRRGCGALYMEPNPRLELHRFLAGLQKMIASASASSAADSPRLKGGCYVTGEEQGHWDAWNVAVDVLQGYRARTETNDKPLNTRRARTEFGLPLASERGDDGQDRQPSPVIVKPLAISESTSLPLVLLLSAPHVLSHPPADRATGKPLREQLMLEAERTFGATRSSF